MKKRMTGVLLALALLIALLPTMALPAAAASDEHSTWPEMTGVLSARYTLNGGQVTRLEVGDVFRLELWLNGIDPYAITIPVNWDPTVVTMVNDMTGKVVTSGLKNEGQIGDGFRAGSACYDRSYGMNWEPLYWNGMPVFSHNEETNDGYPYIDNENGHCHIFFYVNAPTAPAQPQLYLSLTFQVLRQGDPNFHFATARDSVYDPAAAEGLMLAFKDQGVIASAMELPPVYIIDNWTDITPVPDDPGIGNPGNINAPVVRDEPSSGGSTGSTGTRPSTPTVSSATVPAVHSTVYPYQTPVYTDAVIKTASSSGPTRSDNYILPESYLAAAINKLLDQPGASAIVVRMPEQIIDKEAYTVSFSCANLDDLVSQRAAMLHFETPYGFVGVNTAALLYQVSDSATVTLSASPVTDGIKLTAQVDGKAVEGFSSPVFLLTLPYSGESKPTVVSSTVFGAAYRTAGTLPLPISHFFAESGAVSFLTPSAGTYVLTQSSPQSFADVPDTYWGHTAISTLSGAGIVNGKTADTFVPEGLVTRAELAKLVTCTLSTYDAGFVSEFDDVAAADWFYPYVGSASSLGIVKGAGDGTFLPNNKVTRQDMAVMAYRGLRLLGVELPQLRDAPEFTDADAIADYAREAITALYQAGLLNGMGNGEFAPTGTATRAQAAQLIFGLYEIVSNLI